MNKQENIAGKGNSRCNSKDAPVSLQEQSRQSGGKVGATPTPGKVQEREWEQVPSGLGGPTNGFEWMGRTSESS